MAGDRPDPALRIVRDAPLLIVDVTDRVKVEAHLKRAQAAPVEPPPRERRPGGGRVLLVDDEESLVRAGKDLLELFGYEVTGFARATEALAALRSDPQRFDVVVTDQNMPGMGGLDLARAVATVRADLPLVLVSGDGQHSTEELLAANIRYRLSKPYTGESLSRALEDALRQ